MDSPIKWHGGKHYFAKKYIALMPPHIHYVEPYAGSLAVLLERDPSGVSEVVNDLNGELTNFWRVLRDPPRQGWAVRLVNQTFWLYLVVSRELWGLLPLTAILTWRYTVALLKWRESSRAD